MGAGGWFICPFHDYSQIAGQFWRCLEPRFEPTRQVGHAVGTRKAQPPGQLAWRRLCVTAAEPGRDSPRQVGVVASRQRRAFQAVEILIGSEDPLRIRTRRLSRLGDRRIGLDRTGEAPQASHEWLGAQNPSAKCLAKRRPRRIVQALIHEADVGTACIPTALIAPPCRQQLVVRYPGSHASRIAIARIARPLPLLRTPHQARTHRVEVNSTSQPWQTTVCSSPSISRRRSASSRTIFCRALPLAIT